MAFTLRDSAEGGQAGGVQTATATVSVEAGDLIAVVAMSNSIDFSSFSDSDGNTYVAATGLTNTTDGFAYCLSAGSTNASLTVTATFANANWDRRVILIYVFNPGGATVTLADSDVSYTGWASSLTGGAVSTTESDAVVVAAGVTTNPRTYSNHQIGGSAADANQTDTTYGIASQWYTIYSSAVSSDAASVTLDTSNSIELVTFAFGVSGGGGVTVTVADSFHAHALDTVSVTQSQNILVSDSSHTHALDSVVVQQIQNISIESLFHAGALDSVSITQTQNVAVSGLFHSHIVGRYSYIEDPPGNFIGVDDGLELTQQQNISVESAFHTHALDTVAVAIGERITAIADDLFHAQVLDGIGITQSQNITVADLYHDHVLDAVSTTPSVTVSIDSLSHTHTVDGVALTQAHLIIVDDLTHEQITGTVALTQSHYIALQNLVNAQGLDSVNFTIAQGTVTLTFTERSGSVTWTDKIASATFADKTATATFSE